MNIIQGFNQITECWWVGTIKWFPDKNFIKYRHIYTNIFTCGNIVGIVLGQSGKGEGHKVA